MEWEGGISGCGGLIREVFSLIRLTCISPGTYNELIAHDQNYYPPMKNMPSTKNE